MKLGAFRNTATLTVLVIEDEESVRLAIQAGLELIGDYEVLSAPDATAGMAILESAQPDILLLDLVMPGMDGMEFLRLIRNRKSGHMPRRVILMTAHNNPIPGGNLKDIGLDAVLSKPFRLNDLAAVISGT
jgi:CheY-like chemotaxis protein